jgi:2-polyprenyl-3-methyl-5-hydroxy-6-metoxy-1,4-benzoquinol methylase
MKKTISFIQQTKIFLKKLMLPLREIEKEIPRKGLIIDIGCGEGVVSWFLAQKSTYRQVLGIDKNISKIKTAKIFQSYLENLNFISKDVFDYSFPPCGAVVLSDLLHHLSFSKQKALLKRIYQKLDKNGVCLIKEIDKEDKIRVFLSRLWDLLFYPNEKIYYWRKKDLKEELENLGFKVKIKKVKLWFPGSTVLFVCQKL